MSRSTSLQQPRRHFLRYCMCVVIAVGLSACDLFSASSVAQLSQANECPPPLNANIYIPTAAPTPMSSPSSPIITNTTETISPISKHEAFQYLDHQVRTWTDIESFNMDDTSQARIIVTFLSPDLIRAVAMNAAIFENPAAPDIQNKTKTGLEQIASREKLIFLITVLSINTNNTATMPHTFALPVTQLKLMSANNLDIAPVYFDQNLEQPVGLSQYNVGFLFYPLSVVQGQACVEVLNSKFDTNIILKTSFLNVDNAKSGAMTWTIEYKPLLDIGHSDPMMGTPATYDEAELFPISSPPAVSDTSDMFWREYAKFVWGRLTPE